MVWLNEGIKALRTATVLPNRGKQSLIQSITLNQMQLMFTEDTAYRPASSSNATDAAFALPFGFPVDIIALEQTINVGFDGTNMAELVLPKAATETEVDERIIHIKFDDVPFAVLSGQNSVFDRFVASIATTDRETMRLSGSANGDAKTAVGTLALQGLDFDVESSIGGLQGLNTVPVVISDLDVNRGFPEFLLIKVQSRITNPR